MSGQERPTTVTRRQRALELLAEGLPPQAVAEQLGIAPRSIRRYLASPDARETLRRLRDERLRQLAGRALAEASPALATLRAIVEDAATPPQARVSAAGRLLDVALRLAEAVDLAERVEALEEQVQERGGRYGRIA
jgi:predicted ArsR family transcriptional regulator